MQHHGLYESQEKPCPFLLGSSQQPESLLNMVPVHGPSYLSADPQLPSSQRHEPSFYPVDSDEFQDFTLKEILDLADDCALDAVVSGHKDLSLQNDLVEAPFNNPFLAEKQLFLDHSCYLEQKGTLQQSFLSEPSKSRLSSASSPSSTFASCSESKFEALKENEGQTLANRKTLVSMDNCPLTDINSCVTPDSHKSLFNTKRIRSVSVAEDVCSDGDEESKINIQANGRFRPYQEDQWADHFKNLCDYHRKEGNCQVPHLYPPNPSLARWVKRQRYSYKVLKEGKASSMTLERIAALEGIGFVWDSQSAAWEDRFRDLTAFRYTHGHCNVPSRFGGNPKLATWVKCQRRQYRAYREGRHSTMTTERISNLESIGFQWFVKPYRPAKKARTC